MDEDFGRKTGTVDTADGVHAVRPDGLKGPSYLDTDRERREPIKTLTRLCNTAIRFDGMLQGDTGAVKRAWEVERR